MYRKLQLYFTPEIEVFYMMFERYHTNNRKMYLKQHIKYANFRSTLYRAAQHLESYILCNQFWEFPWLVGCYCS